jgi:hypothetical protein
MLSSWAGIRCADAQPIGRLPYPHARDNIMNLRGSTNEEGAVELLPAETHVIQEAYQDPCFGKFVIGNLDISRSISKLLSQVTIIGFPIPR